ncbi:MULTISPECIES: flagellar biosynthesis protein FliQ [Vibrio]|jgi:flagellar biosynthetic protein FliQ|uniref:Flagellar biosynthetic protein FliQ n=1 Tax=Vibrio diazotrophicus TaxID=685 RepID=A0A2J8HW82_VIBDI|nr:MULTISPECIES: flagellar biosynthesis protein FliQ [Vibrio]MBD0786789.1 flagellar biosynthesis protein FliQ [Vibrio sp. Y2-5]MCF7364164.1 flagellar biosynthesis protein FliQ [Vibrio sp. A1-b2]MCZ4373449.1 flagellar biosynthesis protein FliQ [Vibrio diazotrophicus]NIY93237.1 flagellar biosynthesis protein FliQ [Vibrio diazotrophicus]PNH78842.1 flagellar biosynthetic protein FliQ [Vibrio diazotrophicus]
MTPEYVVTLISQAVWLIILIVAVLVVPGLIVGLGVAVFQAATQINEQTLSFLPRLIVTMLMVIFAGHWMIRQIMELFDYLFLNIPGMLG